MTKEQFERIERLQKYLVEKDIDVMLVSSQDSIFYFTSASYTPLERPFFIVVKKEGTPDLVVPQLELEHMKKVEGLGEVKSYFEYPSIQGQNWYDKLLELTGPDVVMGIEPSLPTANMQKIVAKEVKVVDYIDQMRMVKSESELEAIRLASKYTDEGMQQTFSGLYRGESVLETNRPAKEIQTMVIKDTDYDPGVCSFLTLGWPAPKSSQPHSTPDLNSRMGDGPILLMSFNRVNGYAAECERTVFLGDPKPNELELYNHVMKAREIAYSMVRPGVRCEDIDKATQAYFAEHGLDKYILHRTGHGIGMGNHEAPWLSVGADQVLEENMVISIEPGIYIDDIGGFRHSDTVLVTKDGYEVLTKFPSDLESLIIRKHNVKASMVGKLVRKAVNYPEVE